MPEKCTMCKVVKSYIELAGEFASILGEVLVGPVTAIFLAVVGLWVVIHGIRAVMGKGNVFNFFDEGLYVILASALLMGQGPDLVRRIYDAALATMGGAASAVLSAGSGGLGEHIGIAGHEAAAGLDGMAGLVQVAEGSLMKVVEMAGEIIAATSTFDWTPALYGIALAAPYFLLLIVYFAQVVVSIFRVMVFATLSPFLMLALDFNFGRDTFINGLRTVVATFMVLYASTVALGICLYGVSSLDIGSSSATDSTLSEMASIANPDFILAVAMGWLGTAFLMEATSMANSITNAQLTNQAAAVITAGATATGMALMRPGNIARAGGMITGAGGAMTSGAFGAASAASYIGAAARDPGGAFQAAKQAAYEATRKRIARPSFGGDS